MLIDKHISYQIENQFPNIYKESGKELIAIVKSYYEFLENNDRQSIYNNRRLFEYRDIDNTLEKMVIYFKNKYMSDLPALNETFEISLKNIMSLYRRKGTKEGIELFFKMFYRDNAKIYYPSEKIFKPSDSEWKVAEYLQLFPNVLSSPRTLYAELLNKNISGSVSKAEAIVNNVTFMIINQTMIPILFIDNISGKFISNDEIISKIDEVTKRFGVVYGSPNNIEITNDVDRPGTYNNSVGDILYVKSDSGKGAKVLVKEVSTDISGQVEYSVLDGGFGYSVEGTSLLVSNQLIELPLASTFSPNSLDELHDNLGNIGIVIYKKLNFVGVRMNPGDEFTGSSVIMDANSAPIVFLGVTIKNETFPGNLRSETGLSTDVSIDELLNSENISLVTTQISNYLNVPLSSANYNLFPALTPMSLTTNPVNIGTTFVNAFTTQNFTVGTIKNFKNINFGDNYTNDVFALAYDKNMFNYINKNNQIIKTTEDNSRLFRVGAFIFQGTKRGIIKRIDYNFIYVLPYSVSGFELGDFTYNGSTFEMENIERDYESQKFAFNSNISTNTFFSGGKVLRVEIIDSGYGYVNDSISELVDELGNFVATCRISATSSGISEGSWRSFNSHIGFDYGIVIQDSDYYQEYSYEIRSKIDINKYRKELASSVHLAGTKMFGAFYFEDQIDISSNILSFIEI